MLHEARTLAVPRGACCSGARSWCFCRDRWACVRTSEASSPHQPTPVCLCLRLGRCNQGGARHGVKAQRESPRCLPSAAEAQARRHPLTSAHRSPNPRSSQTAVSWTTAQRRIVSSNNGKLCSDEKTSTLTRGNMRTFKHVMQVRPDVRSSEKQTWTLYGETLFKRPLREGDGADPPISACPWGWAWGLPL